MTERARMLIEQARALTPEQREDIAEALIDSIAEETQAEIDAAWVAEGERRWAEFKRSGERGLDPFEAIAEMREQLAKESKEASGS
jgi:putative addiction module component (TIGR02574 family)